MATVTSKQFFSGSPVTVVGNEANIQEEEKKNAKPSGFTDLLGKLKGRVSGVVDQVKNIKETATDENLSTGEKIIGTAAEIGRTPLKVVGAVGGAVGDTLEEGLEATGVTEKIAGALEGTGTAEQLAKAGEQWKKFAEANPEMASTLGDIGNMFNIIPAGLGVDAVKASAKAGGKTITETVVEGTKAGVKSATEKIVSPLSGMRGYLSDAAEQSVKKDVTELLNTRGMTKKVQDFQTKGIDLNETLSDPQVFAGIKVQNKRINPDEAILTLDTRIDQMMDAKKDMLPEVDRLSPDISREDLYKKAVAAIQGRQSPADTKVLEKAIREQVDALPEFMKPSQVDAYRAQFRTSGRDAKGIMKSSNEYAALERATREAVFEATDALPVANAGDYKALNDYVKKMIGTRDFLDESLRNQAVKGGLVRNLAGRTLGAIAGTKGGVLGAIAGSEVGGAIADIITNASLGSSVKMRLIRNLTDDPEILQKADELVKQLQDTDALGLPAPGGTSFREPTMYAGDKGITDDLQKALDAKVLEKPGN